MVEIRDGNHKLTDFADERGIIRGLVAEDATFVGPCVIASMGGGVDFVRPNFMTPDSEALVWEIDPARSTVLGAIGLDGCAFVRCTFREIGVALPPEKIAPFLSTLMIRGNDES